jgi:hypothetical protein
MKISFPSLFRHVHQLSGIRKGGRQQKREHWANFDVFPENFVPAAWLLL